MKKVILLVMLLPLQAFSQIVIELPVQNNLQSQSEGLISFISKECGNIIISEIMADPSPPVGLPEDEYIEIYNRSGTVIDLGKWQLCIGNQCITFSQVEIKGDEYLILCSHTDTSKFRNYGRVIGFKSFPSLPAEKGTVFIKDSQDKFVHGIEYTSDWYNNKLKEAGGWSLEMKDTDFPFHTEGNWQASDSGAGGTPGKKNSVSGTNPDNTFYGIENVFPSDSLTFEITFSESVPYLPELQEPLSIEGHQVSLISGSDRLLRRFIFRMTEPLRKGEVCTVTISDGLTDFAGNLAARGSFRFGLPVTADKRDIVFNELLFNPLPESYDYFELVNCSNKIIDASQLFTVSINPETGDTSALKCISQEGRCIIPGSLYAVTTNPENIASIYNSSDRENIHKASSLSSMPDDKGHLLLLSRKMDVIDEVVYSEKQHYPLISDNEGISLEKIRPDLPSMTGSNWHSASESSGWGTPGAVNSVYNAVNSSGDQLILSSRRISPDNDGNEDVLIIDFNLEGNGNIISVTIFDETGNFIKNLAENFLSGDHATLAWNGLNESGSLVQTGIYIILVNLYNDKGKIRSFKKVCTVIR
ncbi:MAG TPA: lamin tail domain-containing protein [Bacteroidales bacterium]|nr:MAG: hypothetical protein BWX96_01285 [Bacteroidetes bacterium ADurb.Bin145]HOU03497.1 lamin tail domain-containing protein [Bacteroidales bacterium]HQK67636.1 lamin tail domain-containing protein [Bacteroidales bacterium]